MENQQLLAAAATAAAMALCLIYLYWRTLDPFLLPWLAATSIWVLRYAWSIAELTTALPAWTWLIPFLTLTRGLLMFVSGRWLLGFSIPRGTSGLAVAATLWVLLSSDPSEQPWALLVPHGVLGLGLAYAGIALMRAPRFLSFESGLTGAGMILLGAIQLLYPLAYIEPWSQPFGFASSAALHMIISVGILLTYFRGSVVQSTRIADRRELALTHVLSDFVSICAHCKRVRDDQAQRWMPVEGYVSARTEAHVNATHCPECRHG